MEATQPQTFKRAFKEAVHRYLISINQNEAIRAQYTIKRIVDETTEPDAREQIREVLAESNFVSYWLDDHFTPGSLYVERGCVYGWWRDEQLQAEWLPVELSKSYFKGFEKEMRVTNNRNGFRVAVASPPMENNIVCVPEFQTNQYAPWGWANALPLQWHRSADSYTVDRAILALEFWPAWKWWPGAGEFYELNPPSPLVTSFDYCGMPACDFWTDF